MTPESTGVTRKAAVERRSSVNHDKLTLDRRLYRKHSGAARSGGRRAAVVWWTSGQIGRLPLDNASSSQSEVVDGVENLTHSSDGESGDQTSEVSRSDVDVPLGEQRFGDGDDAVRRRGLSEDVTDTIIGRRSWSSDLGVGDVVDRSSAGPTEETVGAVSGGSSWRPYPSVKLKRHDGLSGTEAKDRRASWAMKRLQSSGLASLQHRDKFVSLSGAASNADDEERTDVQVSDDLERSSESCLVDSPAQTNSRQNSEDRLGDGEGADFVPDVDVVADMLRLSEGVATDNQLQAVSDKSTASRADLSATSGETDVPRRHSDGMVSNRDVTDSVDNSVFETEKQRNSAVTVDEVTDDYPAVVSRVDVPVSGSRRSRLDATDDIQLPAKSRGDSYHCGTYRTSYGPGHGEAKSDPALVCSPGTVRHYRDLFESTVSPTVTSPAALPRALGPGSAVVHGTSERRGADTGGRQSSLSCVHSLRISTSSDGQVDSATSTSPEVRQRVSPVVRKLSPDPDQEHYQISDSVQLGWTTSAASAKLDFEQSSRSSDNDEGRLDSKMFRLRRTSSVEDDLHRLLSSTREFNEVTTTSNPDISDRVRSYNDLLVYGAAQLQDAGRMDPWVGRTLNGALAGSSQCVSVIAWHRPYRRPRPSPRAPVSGHTLTNSVDRRRMRTDPLNNGMYRQVADTVGSLRTAEVEIARHKPEIFGMDEMTCHQQSCSIDLFTSVPR